MVRDFISIDSRKVKQTIKSCLDMTDGDMSGNKLGFSSKIVPVVNLNAYNNIKKYEHALVTEAVGSILYPFGINDKSIKKLKTVVLYQSNTETNDKNIGVYFKNLDDELFGNTIVLANGVNRSPILNDEPDGVIANDVINAGGISTFGHGVDILLKELEIRIESAAGTAQEYGVIVWYEE